MGRARVATARDRWAATVVALTLVSAPVAARAHASAPDATARKHVAVVPLTVEGPLPADVGTRLGDTLVAGLGEDAALAAGVTTTCEDAACWRALGAQLGATHIVHATVTVDDRDYTISASLVDAASGEVVASSARRCEICGYDEVAETVTDVAVLVRRKLSVSTVSLPVLSVTSTPAGALVTVDGERVGNTPLELKLKSGAHDVRVGMNGYVARLERVVLVDGVHEQVDVVLEPQPVREKSGGLRAAGAAATVVGIAGLGVGIGLAVLDEAPIRSRCSGDDKDIEGHCKYRYDSLAAGVTIAVVGAAALATGIALLVVDRRRARARRVALRPGPYGLALAF